MKQRIENPDEDDRLAEFTDSVLAGKSDQPDSKADDDLRGIEETILRLKRALPQADVDKLSLRHLEARLNAHLHRKQEQAQIPFWQKWFGRQYGQFRAQSYILAALFLLVIVAFLINLLFPPNVSDITATAYTGSNTFIKLVALAGSILAAIWISRRK